MDGKLKSLNKMLNNKAIETILFIIPIAGITHNLYVWRFNDYTIDLGSATTFLTDHSDRWLFAALVYMCLFMTAFSIERKWVPLTMTLFVKKLNPDTYEPASKKSKKIVRKLIRINPLKSLPDIPKKSVYHHFSILPVTVALWLIFANAIWSYIMLVVLALVTYYFFKVINSIYADYLKY